MSVGVDFLGRCLGCGTPSESTGSCACESQQITYITIENVDGHGIVRIAGTTLVIEGYG